MTKDTPPPIVEAVARALFDAAETTPGAVVPVIAAEDLAKAALDAIKDAGFDLVPRGP
jgi:hypothetical protein